MIIKANCIVLNYTKYGDNSLIIKALTNTNGLQSFIAKSTHQSKSKTKANCFQPLSQLEIVFYKKENNQLAVVKEINFFRTYHTIPYEILKSSTAFLLAEILNKTIKEHEKNSSLFDFITSSLNWLDEENDLTLIENFRLIFLLHLTKHLGFYPSNLQEKDCKYFCIEEGRFLPSLDTNFNCLSLLDSSFFSSILNCNSYGLKLNVNINATDRARLLDYILHYYKFHLGNLLNINSKEMLLVLSTI